MADSNGPAICDYEGSTYRTDFWEGQGRDYEDRAERTAIRRLLPPTGGRLLEIGAGFGRLTQMYRGYDQVVLLDYSRSQLEYARQQFGDDGFLYVAANLYDMPFAQGVFDAATMVRVLHHLEDPPAALREIRSLLRQGGVFVLEFANKQNLKAIVRWALRRQAWNPFDHEPVEFVELHYDFHPKYIQQALQGADLMPGRMLTVSHFRVGVLKRTLPASVLASLDALAALTGAWWQLSPSVFIRSTAVGPGQPAAGGAFWRCPVCRSTDVAAEPDGLRCEACGAEVHKKNGVYDFKEPLPASG